MEEQREAKGIVGGRYVNPENGGGEEQGSRGSCYKGGIGYAGICIRCPIEDRAKGILEGKERQGIYLGESHRTLFRRSDDHFRAYTKKSEKSWMWEHTVSEHGGEIVGDGRGDYKFKVMGTFRDPTSRIADECVRIGREERGEHETVGNSGYVKVLNGKDKFYPSKLVKVNFVQF